MIATSLRPCPSPAVSRGEETRARSSSPESSCFTDAVATHQRYVAHASSVASNLMTTPAAPPSNSASSNAPPSGHSKLDVALIVVLVLVLVPAVLFNALIWMERLLGLGIYDPAIGGDPSWRGRPVALPLAVAVVAVIRMVLARRRWPLTPSKRRILVLLFIVGGVSATAFLAPEPNFFAR